MKTVSNDVAQITYRDDGILFIIYADRLLTKTDAELAFNLQRENAPWEISPILAKGSSFSNLDAEARDFFSSDQVMKHCSGLAIIAESLGQKIAANFFIKFSKPTKPTKFFSDETEALEWLKQFETKNI